ncbi:MAG: NADH-quinone oxidoreductase subunit D [Thermoplasmata archaeon]|nr:NADH-quinone oxidoreductase subunit D [Thermoplasmata archaeon]
MEERIIDVNFGPQHPSTHGVLRVKVKLNGETIVNAEPIIGYLHRNAEKLSEDKFYPSVAIFMDRLDYVSNHNMELGYVLAVEKLAEVQVPERANWIRMMVVELNRIASHLVWAGTMGLDLGMITPFFYTFREREKIIQLFEMLSGARLTYNYISIGGVYKDIPGEFKDKFLEFYNEFPKRLDEIQSLFMENEIFIQRMKGIGYLSPEKAMSYSITGPVLRASGIKYDIRKNFPYLYYDKVDFEIPTAKDGDNFSRFIVRMEEMRQSLKIAKQAFDKMPEGEYFNPLYRKQGLIKIKGKGESYSRTESPRGEFGVYVIGDGTSKPYRVRIRSPAFHALSATNEMVKGSKIADMIATLSTLDPVFGEVDR